MILAVGACGSTRDRAIEREPARGDASAAGSAARRACKHDSEPCAGECNPLGYCEQDLGWGPEVRVPAGNYVVYVRSGRLPMGKAEDAIATFPSSFWIAKHELSIGLAKRCTSCGLSLDGADHTPVQLTRAEAEALCATSGRRLPTNSEWEAAGRGPTSCTDPEVMLQLRRKAGCNDRYFPWGDEDADFCSRALIGDCKATGPRPVAPHPEGASPLGVEEMIGNVSEWISDEEEGSGQTWGMVKGGDWELPGDSQAFALVTLIARQRAKPEWKYGVRCVRGPVMEVHPTLKSRP